MDVAYEIASHLAKTTFQDIPKDVVEHTKKLILNILGTTLAGSTAGGCRETAELIGEWKGKTESTVFSYGYRVPSPQAALVNGMMANARDFDDFHDVAIVYAGVSVIPASLAVAERVGASGRDLITAVTLGLDLVSRLALSITVYKGWHYTAVCGAFGAAAAAGKLLGLDEKKMLNALGIVFSQAAGNLQSIHDGALVKRMQPGLAAQAGVLSASLAERGVTGSKEIFQGQSGFFTLYDGGAREPKEQRDPSIYKFENLMDQLGQRFEGSNIAVKPYPSARGTHVAIEATLDLIKAHSIAPNDVAECTCYVSQFIFNLNGKPFVLRENPEVDAQPSLYYTLATALLRGDVFITDFEEEAIRDPKVMGMIGRVRVLADSEIKDRFACRVAIKTKAGQTYSKELKVIKGQRQNPMTYDEVAAKFRKCAAHAAKPIPAGNQAQVIALVDRLEEQRDIRPIIKLLS